MNLFHCDEVNRKSSEYTRCTHESFSGNPDPNHVSGTEVGWKARSEAHQRTDLQSCSGARASVGRLKID